MRYFNEGKACDAVVRRIEEREGAPREKARSPEREGHPAPVELVCTIGGHLFAFEHTGIEPFSGQIEMAVKNQALFSGLDELLAGALPGAEYFQLLVPVDASLRLTGRDIPRIRNAVTRWIQNTAHGLPIAPYGRYATPILDNRLEGVPFALSLHRSAVNGVLRGKFSVKFVVTSDLEAARRKRLQKACDDKFSKLAAWRRERGAQTVLVLEENDIQLTNDQLVADALASVEKGRNDIPDEVFLVSTYLDSKWHVSCLRRAGKTYYDEGERFWEINPALLRDATGRCAGAV